MGVAKEEVGMAVGSGEVVTAVVVTVEDATEAATPAELMAVVAMVVEKMEAEAQAVVETAELAVEAETVED